MDLCHGGTDVSLMITTTLKWLHKQQVTVAMQRSHLACVQTALLHVVGGRGPLSKMDAANWDGSE